MHLGPTVVQLDDYPYVEHDAFVLAQELRKRAARRRRVLPTPTDLPR